MDSLSCPNVYLNFLQRFGDLSLKAIPPIDSASQNIAQLKIAHSQRSNHLNPTNQLNQANNQKHGQKHGQNHGSSRYAFTVRKFSDPDYWQKKLQQLGFYLESQEIRASIEQVSLNGKFPLNHLSSLTGNFLLAHLIGKACLDFAAANKEPLIAAIWQVGHLVTRLHLEGVFLQDHLLPQLIAACPNIEELRLSVIDGETLHFDIAALNSLKKLKRLHLDGLQTLYDLKGLKGKNLTELSLSNCGVEELADLKNLEKLSLFHAKKLKNLASLDAPKLKELTAFNCGLQHLNLKARLKRLDISLCPYIQDLAQLETEELATLIAEESGLHHLRHPSGFPALVELDISNCRQLLQIQGLQAPLLKKLKMTDLALNALELEEMLTATKAQLHSLDISRCIHFNQIMSAPLKMDLSQLKTLNAAYSGLALFSGYFPKLKDLDIQGCPLSSLKEAQMPQLTHLWAAKSLLFSLKTKGILILSELNIEDTLVSDLSGIDYSKLTKLYAVASQLTQMLDKNEFKNLKIQEIAETPLFQSLMSKSGKI